MVSALFSAFQVILNRVQKRWDERITHPFPSEDPTDLTIFFLGKVEDEAEETLTDSERSLLFHEIQRIIQVSDT